jgi:hypothetical protein
VKLFTVPLSNPPSTTASTVTVVGEHVDDEELDGAVELDDEETELVVSVKETLEDEIDELIIEEEEELEAALELDELGDDKVV